MRRCFILFFCSAVSIADVNSQDRITNDPDSALIVTTDITNFWNAFDLLQKQKTEADSLAIIRSVFINRASDGLKQYIDAANCHEQEYLTAIREKKKQYQAIRSKSESLAGQKGTIVQYLHTFKRLYPLLRIPAICLTVGKFEVGGTQFSNTLYIGCEKILLMEIDVAAQTIHELVHFQQKEQNPSTNLELAMIEGGAEFVSVKITGKRTIPLAWTYGSTHEKELAAEFHMIAESPVAINWFLDSFDRLKNRPGSLAYFIGFKICEAYYKTHRSTALALKELVEMENPKKLFAKSAYQ